MQDATPRERFTALVQRGEADIDLAEAALLIAAEAYPRLDVTRHLAALDRLADAAEPRLSGATSDLARARVLIHFLAAEQRFSGNQGDYHDVRNSFLNEVLERRTGIPITLALVYIEVGRRLGLPMVGIGFPGHFLVKLAGVEDIVIDPFFGCILDEQACAERLRSVVGQEATFDRRLLRAATAKEILVRMLRNLKQIYLQARELKPALACSERILLVEPELAHELRDRGLLYHQLECYAAAQLDLQRFLSLAPGDDSADAIRDKLIEIRRHGGTTLH
jgi:regulator of sirC expression with transglutaminase-like and TPR domain